MAVPTLVGTLVPTDHPRHGHNIPWPLLAVIIVAAIAVLRVISNKLTFGRPPVLEGVPFVGGVLKFMGGPMGLMKAGYDAYGEVFTVPVLHKKITFLIGPHVSAHFYKATDDDMSQKEVYEFNVPTFGKGVVFDVDHKVRAEQFRFFAEALKTQRMKLYVPQFVQEAEDHFQQGWGEEGVVDLHAELSKLIIKTASRTLLGREVRESMFDEVAHLIHDLDMGMLPISVLAPYIPIAAHRRRDQARAELARLFTKVIKARRAANLKEEDAPADVLQSLVTARYSPSCYGGRELNEEEITGMLIAVLFAGQHTSSITSTWTGLSMLTHPETLAAAQQEQRELVARRGTALNMDTLQELPVLQNNITEALRLFPPLIMLMRQVKRTFSVTTRTGQTYTIPKGHIAATSPAFAHRLDHVFPRPGAYEPQRFAPPRAEDKAQPFSFVGFGAGRHGCMGSNFAFLQVKTVWSILLRDFELEMVDPFPEADFDSMVVGPKPCRVKYRRRKLISQT